MNLPILNRDFKKPTDEWYHIVPKGRFAHPDGVTQVIDDKALSTMLNRFNEEAKAANFTGLLVDFEHFSYEEDKSSEAAGWITQMENRAEGLFAKIRWSDLGETAITNGRYRKLSPVWVGPRDIEKISVKEVRPVRLDSVGLTNQPNLRGMVPLSNRAPGGDADSHKQQQNRTKQMKNVCVLLGLSEDASEASVTEAVRAIKNRVTTLEGEATPLKNRIAELETTNKGLLDAQIESDLVVYGNRFKLEDKEKVKAQLIANRAGTIELLKLMPEGTKGTSTTKPMHNRNTSGKTDSVAENLGAEDNAKAERELVAKQEEAIDAYRMANRNVSYGDARNAVRMKKPELFGIAN